MSDTLCSTGTIRKITQSPLEGRGNRKFAEIQHFYFDPKMHVFAPPIFVFIQKETSGSRKGYREFSGYGIPVRCMINTQREKKSSRYFTNLTIELALFSLAKENEQFDWAWIDARRNGDLDANQVLQFAPMAWREWVKNGRSAIERCRRNIAKHKIVKAREQGSIAMAEKRISNEAYAFYAKKKHPFEGLASYVAKRIVGHGCKRGWVTKRSGDMGMPRVSPYCSLLRPTW